MYRVRGGGRKREGEGWREGGSEEERDGGNEGVSGGGRDGGSVGRRKGRNEKVMNGERGSDERRNEEKNCRFSLSLSLCSTYNVSPINDNINS